MTDATLASRNSMELPTVSVVIPCRNEARFILPCLDSLIDGDFPRERLEVLVVDGNSDDETPRLIAEYSRRHPWIRLLDNPAKITAAGLNVGIRAARAPFIAWLSAHNVYPPSYLRDCIEAMVAFDADNAGGRIVTVPREPGLIGDSLVEVLRHPVGVGGSRFRIGARAAGLADTVFGGCYRREVFERIGLFNENLVRGQDLELNLRLKRAGLRTILVPDIRSIYLARTRLTEFALHTYRNGVWAILPTLYSDGVPIRPRHLVPLASVLFLLATAVGALLTGGTTWWLALVAAALIYLAVIICTSIAIAVRRRRPAMALILPVLFATLHVAYGFGSLIGAGQAAIIVLQRSGRRPGPAIPRLSPQPRAER